LVITILGIVLLNQSGLQSKSPLPTFGKEDKGEELSEAKGNTNGLVVMLTDFGEKDFYVGAMKGAIYSTYEKARIDSITHQITKFDIAEGAYTLARAAAEFPSGTVFVAVVDPGVGSERKPIALKTKDGKYFVGPDNGLFTLVIEEFGLAELREITNPALMRKSQLSSTFHGRDIFGPVAAHLAAGIPLEEVGPIMKNYVNLKIQQARVVNGQIIGEISSIDEYGNTITNISQQLFDEAGFKRGDVLNIQFDNGSIIKCQYSKTYSDVPVGQYVCLFGTSGFEIAINQGNFAEKLNLKSRMKVTISTEK
jgi:S-adenosylmethionine hydrolase